MYTGSSTGLSEMTLIAHLLDNLHLGEAREDGSLRIELAAQVWPPVERSE